MILKIPLPFGLLTVHQLFLMTRGLPHPLDTVLDALVAPQELTSAAPLVSAVLLCSNMKSSLTAATKAAQKTLHHGLKPAAVCKAHSLLDY